MRKWRSASLPTGAGEALPTYSQYSFRWQLTWLGCAAGEQEEMWWTIFLTSCPAYLEWATSLHSIIYLPAEFPRKAEDTSIQ